jgi:predicted transcriptional regulator
MTEQPKSVDEIREKLKQEYISILNTIPEMRGEQNIRNAFKQLDIIIEKIDKTGGVLKY